LRPILGEESVSFDVCFFDGVEGFLFCLDWIGLDWTYICLSRRPATFDFRKREWGGEDFEGGCGEEEEVDEG
jgi:hypothetical protein